MATSPRRATGSHGLLALVAFGVGSVIASATAAAAPARDELSRAEELQRRAEELYEEDDYEQALPLRAEACSIFEKAGPARAQELAVCLTGLGLLHFKQGAHPKGLELAERAVSIHEKLRRPEGAALAESLNTLAFMYNHQARYQEAKPLFERALEIRERVLGPDHVDVAMVLNNLGSVCEELGEYAKAVRHYERALAIVKGNDSSEHRFIAMLYNNLGHLYHEQADYERAASYFEQSISIREKVLGPEHPDVAIAMTGLAGSQHARGEYEHAEALLERALAITEAALGEDDPRVAIILTHQGRLAKELGEYGRAERLYQRALSIREKKLGPSHHTVATSLNNLASLHNEQGEYGKAEALYLRALAIIEASLGPEHANIGTLLNNLGFVYVRQGELQKAETYYERALHLRERALGPDHPLVAQSLNNLAQLYVQQRAYDRALPLHQRALDIRRAKLGPTHADVAASTSNLAGLHMARGDYEAARPLFEQAITILEQTLGPEHAKLAIAVGELGVLHVRQREHEEAKLLFERALSINEKALRPEHPSIALTLRRLAAVRQALGRHDSALALYRRALRIEEQNLSEALVIAEDSRRLAYAAKLFGSTHEVLSFHLQIAPDDPGAAELALTTLLRRKGLIQELVGRSYAVLRRSLPAAQRRDLDQLARVRAHYAALAQRRPAGMASEAHEARLAALEREQDALWAGLAEHSPQARALLEPVTLQQVQSRLPDGAALVEYARYHPGFAAGTTSGSAEPRYAAYLVFRDRIEWVDLGPATAIDARANELREAIVRQSGVEALAHALYGSIMQPVVDRVGLTSRLFIAPDGDLDLVPFDALVDEYGNYLVERFYLHSLVSGRDLLRPWALEPAVPGTAVIVANAAGADLPGTEHEAALLIALLGDVVSLQHDDATEARLRALEHPGILHLATHGSFGTDRPGNTWLDAPTHELRSIESALEGLPPTQLGNPMLYAWLDLAPPADDDDRDNRGADSDDGKLTAYEISGWDLRGTELVTLSACDTGRGHYQVGEGVLGLRRAFGVAGAQTQVMSLWKVSDATTARLMESYYRRLLAGEGRSEAMRNTQLELLRDPTTRHPYHWAAFVVVGEWGPLSSIGPRSGAGPGPIGARPRGCSTTSGPPGDHVPITLLVLPLLALLRRRGI